MHRFFWIFTTSMFLMADIQPYDMASLPNMPHLKHIKLLDQKTIDFDSISDVPFAEISDLAYDPKKNELFMLSDKGRLFSFVAKFDNHTISISPTSGHYLHKKRKKRLKRKDRDSEGLTLDDSRQLWASFERDPKIAKIAKSGKIVEYAKIPKPIPGLKYLRGANKGLESLAWHSKYGLMTALEYPPKGTSKRDQSIYDMSGKKWNFRIKDIYHPAITAIETMDDGNMMVLVRSYDKRHVRVVIALIKVFLGAQKDGLCRTEVLAKMSTDDGWALDNFEGLTRVSPHKYLMVSDNGGDVFRKTLLIYFEIQ